MEAAGIAPASQIPMSFTRMITASSMGASVALVSALMRHYGKLVANLQRLNSFVLDRNHGPAAGRLSAGRTTSGLQFKGAFLC